MKSGFCAVIAAICISTGIGMGAFCPSGDMDGNCIVDMEDLAILAEQWLDGPGCVNPPSDCADVTGNDGVNLKDFELLAASWGQNTDPVVINEIHYDPDIKTELCEFVELYNPTPREVDLSGWYFSAGIDYTFPAGSKIGADGYLVLAQNTAKFQTKFGQAAFGQFAGKLSNERETLRLKNATGQTIDEVEYQLGFPWPTVGDPISISQPGTGYSIQLIHPSIDNELGGNWLGLTPSPKEINRVYVLTAAPAMRQVEHKPEMPKSGEPVTITVKATGPVATASVMLKYQVVEPGQYINFNDAAFTTNWTAVPMYDDGTHGDALAGDDIYTAVLPGSLQIHRRLIRYKMTATNANGKARNAPYGDDPCPNFAYFVYDGVPAWTAAVRPGVDAPVTYGIDAMRSLPVYHLISKKSDIESSTWLAKYQGEEYPWWGTLIYDGKVYDHIRYRARGGVWRYAMGKNMWKFDLNRGHFFQARDDYGNKYDKTWNKLNFSACIQQGSFGQRGEQGMFEALTFKMFNLTGVPAPKTHWLQFRIIDEVSENGVGNAAHSPLTTGGTQYDGDLWGLYMNIENVDGDFLDEHNLPDGNLYKMDNQVYGDYGQLNNQGATAVTDGSDIRAFKDTYRYYSPELTWWASNLELERYFSHVAVQYATHDGDITEKNHFYYLNPEITTDSWGAGNKWSLLPWDTDLTWTTYYGSMSDPLSREGVFNNATLNIGKKNRIREVCDLLFNSDQTDQLIDENAVIINDPTGGLSIVDVDRAMWDYHWVMSDGAYPTYLSHDPFQYNKAGQGRFYQSAANSGFERSFEGMVNVMKSYVVSRQSYMSSASNDAAIPNTPTVSYAGTANYAVNNLIFQTTAFSDPQGAATFGAMKWRIAEVEPDSTVPDPDPGTDTVLIQPQSQWRYFKGTQEPSATYEAWRLLDFNDDPASTSWVEGDAPVGYDPSVTMGSTLDDMKYNYTTIYLRKEFTIDDLSKIDKLVLGAFFDDGFNAWINGTYVGHDNVGGENLPYDTTTANMPENNLYKTYEAPKPFTYLRPGRNVIAIQVLNIPLGQSSDCYFDATLTAKPVAGEPIPEQPRNYGRKARKYEIEPAWESPEMTTFASTIQVPASVVKANRIYRVRCRMKDTSGRWSHWSNPVPFTTLPPMAAGIVENLRITEVMYNPLDDGTGGYKADDFEYIELKNIGDEVLDLSGVSFTSGISFAFAGSAVTTLGPGEFVLVVSNKPAFLTRDGQGLAGRVAGQYSTAADPQKLSNNGEGIRLEDFWNGVIADFEYSDGRLWPLAADGAGHSLVPLAAAIPGQAGGSYNYPAFWRASAVRNGSPGADDPEPTATLLINEVMAHTDYVDPGNPLIDSNDWIEIINAGSAAVNLGDYYLSDDADELKKWRLPSQMLGVGERAVFDEVTGFHSPFPSGFGLDKAGEQVLLSYLPGTANDRVADAVKFAGQENMISFGRYPDGGAYWLASPMTRGQANAVPIWHVVISEVQYHVPTGSEEFIELYNPTAQVVALFTEQGPWRIAGGADYTFPAGKSIAAGERIVVVGFDPLVETVRFNAFKAAFPGTTFTAGTNLFGPGTGDLSNVAERVSLEKPIPADLPDTTIPWIVVDEVSYYDELPWPVGADGTGKSIHRISAAADISGCEPGNWQIANPSPTK